MRKFLSFLTIALVALQLSAAPVDVATAKTKAQQYLTQKVFAGKFMVPGATDAKLVKTEMGDKAKAPVYYIFNTETTFIIVSGDDRAEEVLAYGDRPLNLDRIPTNMQVWLDGYKRQIDWLLTNPDAKVEKPTTVKAAGLKATTYGPLLTALWDQTEPYWNQCKFTYSGTTYQCYTGCPATSASMVMYYWKYPKGQVPAMPSYTNSLELSSYNTVSFAYPALPATTFDWDNMIDDYTSPAATGYTTAQGNAVATLMRYVGQGEQMMYGTASAGGSGIYTSNAQIVADMYINFGYDETTTRLVRKSNYTEAQWAQLLQTEMIEGRPVVFMAVDNSAGGHAFNVDGYDSSTNKYHINFGWSGDGNNWCAMNAFADGEGYNFNSDQQMIIGIQPGSGFIKATPENLDFTGYAGETYTKTFRVEARGMENNITIAQSGSNVFTISNTTITPAQAENGVDVTVTYKPTAAGNTTASLTLSCADEGVDDVTVQLTGVAKPRVPTLVADPTSLSFVAKLGKTVTKTINLTGVFLTGNVTATLTDPSGVFSVSPATIAPTSFNGETPLQVAVSFMSNEEANYTGSLTFASNGAESVTVQLSAKANDGGTATDPYLDIAKYETIDEAGASVSGMQTIYKYTEYADQECGWLTLSNYGVKQADANQDWFESGSLTQYGNSWSSSDIFLGQTPYFGSSSAYSVYGSNSQSFYVTNCIQVKAYVKGSSYSYSSSSASLSIYECTVNANGSVTASSSAFDTKTGSNGVISSTTLDATKVYKVQLTGGGSYPDLLEIGFRTPLTSEATLAQIESEGHIGNRYTVSDELVAVDYAIVDDAIYLWCKDQGNAIAPAPAVGDKIDYLGNDQYAQNGRAWDESNWVALKFSVGSVQTAVTSITSAKGHKINAGTITGVYSDATNYTIAMPEGEGLPTGAVGDKFTYTPNVYCVANFNPAYLTEDGAQLKDNGNVYFFMTPKVQEVCEITYAYWNAENFIVPTTSGFVGSLSLDWTYNEAGNVTSQLNADNVYRFKTIVQRTGATTSLPALKAEGGAYKVAPLNLTSTSKADIPTAIGTVKASVDVVDVYYVNSTGLMSKTPFQGVNIIVTRYSDGSRTTVKKVFK